MKSYINKTVGSMYLLEGSFACIALKMFTINSSLKYIYCPNGGGWNNHIATLSALLTWLVVKLMPREWNTYKQYLSFDSFRFPFFDFILPAGNITVDNENAFIVVTGRETLLGTGAWELLYFLDRGIESHSTLLDVYATRGNVPLFEIVCAQL